MFEVKIGDETVKAEVTFYTAVLYEQEFQSDLVADLFGVQDEDSTPVKLAKGGNIVSIDFSKISWLSVAKATWAAVKTAEPKTAGYTSWMKEARGTNFWELRELLLNDASECFFRADAAEEDAQEAEE